MRCEKQVLHSAYPTDSRPWGPEALRSATVWIVKRQVVGKAENGGAVSRFPTTSTAAN